MKLSSVVSYKNHLEKMAPLDAAGLIYEKLGPVLHSVQSNDIQFDNLTIQLDNNYHSILSAVDNFEQSIESIKERLEETIAQIEPNYYTESFRLYSQEMIYDTPEYILSSRPLNLSTETSEFIKARIQAQCDWHHAGMIIRPGHENWIEYLVGCDPLYLIDQNNELLEPAVLRFNDQYRRRIRTYVVDEGVDSPILNFLPDRQFAFCLVYNFFNYKPIEIIRVYLNEIFNKLKPGGTMALTVNDCDREGGVKLAESSFSCYTPLRVILEYATMLGFEVKEIFHITAASTWIELMRPGQLVSYKGGQSLAKVLHKNEIMLYNNEEVEKFRQIALDLNIVHPDNINDVPFEQLMHEIKQRVAKG